ncbi:hypothetical protein ACEWY4_025304 [Coilia grayii]|uniref:phospholipase A2 n=1 Tax=Coilia grayii TaxID=363190 RepID=A0ABD1IZT4_9TELE
MRVTTMSASMFTFAVLCVCGLSYAKKEELRCVRAQSIINGTQVSFLHRKAGVHSEAFVLYSSIWDKDRQLVYCKTNEEDVVVRHYLSVCVTTRNPHDIPAVGYNISAILARDSPCHGNNSNLGQSDEMGLHISGIERRTKRAVIFPGTLWCGTGSKAHDYQQLGMFQRTDQCCREHDHCSSVIRSFTVNFGVFNHNLYTVSHCECDRRFRECLLEVNDAIAHMVGYSFFSILKVPCFEFTQRKHCSQLSWWGRCTKIEMAPYAVLQTQAPYNATDLTTKTEDHVISTTRRVTIKPSVKPSRPFHRKPVLSADCIPPTPARGDIFRPQLKKGKKSRCQKARKVIPSRSTKQSVTPSLQHISFTSVVTTSSKVKVVKITKNNGPFLVSPQTTSQPSVVPIKNTKSPQVTTPKRLRNPTLAQTPPASITTHRFLNQTQPPSLRPSRRPTQGLHCGPRGSPRGDTFFPGHPGREGCPEPALPQMDVPVKESEHRRDMPEIPLARTSTSVKSATLLNEVTTQVKNVALAVTSNDLLVETTELPQGKTKPLTFFKPTLSAEAAPREMTTATQSPEIISPHQTKVAVPTPEKIRVSSKQNTQSAAQNMESSSRVIPVRIVQQKEKSNSASVASKKSNPSGKILCSHLKNLDDCAHKILPFERRYGYYNNESKTIYHCDCTHRLSGHLRHQKNDAKAIQSLLLDHVSLLCFGLQSTKYCIESTRCSAVIFPATGLLVALRKMDYGGAISKQQRPKRYKRTLVRLYKRCIKLMQSKLT